MKPRQEGTPGMPAGTGNTQKKSTGTKNRGAAYVDFLKYYTKKKHVIIILFCDELY